jgi:hypothetical protein
MLNKKDIQKIKELLKELLVDVATKEDLKIIRSGLNHLKREQKSMSAILAIDLSHHSKRLDRLEDVLSLPPLKVPQPAVVED